MSGVGLKGDSARLPTPYSVQHSNLLEVPAITAKGPELLNQDPRSELLAAPGEISIATGTGDIVTVDDNEQIALAVATPARSCHPNDDPDRLELSSGTPFPEDGRAPGAI